MATHPRSAIVDVCTYCEDLERHQWVDAIQSVVPPQQARHALLVDARPDLFARADFRAVELPVSVDVFFDLQPVVHGDVFPRVGIDVEEAQLVPRKRREERSERDVYTISHTFQVRTIELSRAYKIN